MAKRYTVRVPAGRVCLEANNLEDALSRVSKKMKEMGKDSTILGYVELPDPTSVLPDIPVLPVATH